MSKKKEIKKLQEKVNRLLCDLATAYGDIENLINAYPDDLNCLDARVRYSSRYSMEKFLLRSESIKVVDDKKPLVYHDSEGIYGHLASKEIKLFKVPEAGISSQPEIEARIQRQTINDKQMVWGSPADYVFKSERIADKEDEHKNYTYPKKGVHSLEYRYDTYKELVDCIDKYFGELVDQSILDDIILASHRVVEKIDKIAEHNPEPDKGNFPCIDIITVTERLYYHANPDTTMNVPSSFYETVEKWFNQWTQGPEQTSDDFYDWCILNKRLTPLI